MDDLDRKHAQNDEILVTDEELDFINKGSEPDPYGFNSTPYWKIERMLQIAWPKIVQQGYVKLNSEPYIHSGKVNHISNSEFDILIQGTLPEDLLTYLNSIEETYENIQCSGFEIVVTNPLESLPSFPENLVYKLESLLSKLNLDEIVDENSLKAIEFLKDDFSGKYSVYKMYRDVENSIEILRKGILELPNLTKEERDELLKVAELKLKYYLPATYKNRDDFSENSSISRLSKTEDQMPETFGLMNPLYRYFLSSVIGPFIEDNPVYKKFLEIIKYDSRPILIIAGHGGGNSFDDYSIGENFSEGRSLSDLIKTYATPGKYSCILVNACNSNNLELHNSFSTNTPLFYVKGLSGHRTAVEGKYMQSIFYDPLSKSTLEYRNKLFELAGLTWNEQTQSFQRTID